MIIGFSVINCGVDKAGFVAGKYTEAITALIGRHLKAEISQGRHASTSTEKGGPSKEGVSTTG